MRRDLESGQDRDEAEMEPGSEAGPAGPGGWTENRTD